MSLFLVGSAGALQKVALQNRSGALHNRTGGCCKSARVVLQNRTGFVANPHTRTVILLFSCYSLIGYSIVILFMDIIGSRHMKVGAKALQLVSLADVALVKLLTVLRPLLLYVGRAWSILGQRYRVAL